MLAFARWNPGIPGHPAWSLAAKWKESWERYQLLPLNPFCRVSSSLLVAGVWLLVLRTILLIRHVYFHCYSHQTETVGTVQALQSQAGLLSPCILTSRAATSSLTSPTTSCVCGSTVEVSRQSQSRDGEGLDLNSRLLNPFWDTLCS